MSASDRGVGKSTRRPKSRQTEVVDRFRAQHLALAEREIMTDAGVVTVMANDSESPLAWLARRKGRDGCAMISRDQFAAGERLRADFTRGNLTPRVTSNWSSPTGGRPRGSGAGPCEMTDLIIASRQRVRLAMQACGPEFSGLLMDVCCFLRGLEDVERERGWPPRSAKVVLQLALDRLARHYGLGSAGRAEASAHVRTWLASDAAFTVG
ncbi:DUF6456 domain-containing protein [Nitrobacter sp.]|uniref:DUF6456 domain-containing protein n=1 Tax=Nitrobacter sp. TaxID=29420 RepID=UPI0029CABE08|nr:DUF6456 domain-containing protein [Nitrobacter sp.]